MTPVTHACNHEQFSRLNLAPLSCFQTLPIAAPKPTILIRNSEPLSLKPSRKWQCSPRAAAPGNVRRSPDCTNLRLLILLSSVDLHKRDFPSAISGDHYSQAAAGGLHMHDLKEISNVNGGAAPQTPFLLAWQLVLGAKPIVGMTTKMAVVARG